MRPARPYFESHAARESLWVWDPCFKQSNYTDSYHHKNPEFIQLICHAANKIYDRDSYWHQNQEFIVITVTVAMYSLEKVQKNCFFECDR